VFGHPLTMATYLDPAVRAGQAGGLTCAFVPWQARAADKVTGCLR
jgi:hypothetical protein